MNGTEKDQWNNTYVKQYKRYALFKKSINDGNHLLEFQFETELNEKRKQFVPINGCLWYN